MTTTTTTLQSFLADHAITRVWHTAFDCPTGEGHALNTETESDEDYTDSESLLSVLTDWLALDLDGIEGEVSRDDSGEYRWNWTPDGDRRNCRGNSIHRLTVWGQ